MGRDGRARRQAVQARRGERRRPWWPWAVAGTLAGAAAGAGVALVLRRVRAEEVLDPPDPDELRAVVDRPDTEPGTG